MAPPPTLTSFLKTLSEEQKHQLDSFLVTLSTEQNQQARALGFDLTGAELEKQRMLGEFLDRLEIEKEWTQKEFLAKAVLMTKMLTDILNKLYPDEPEDMDVSNDGEGERAVGDGR
jgi:hypothetical protein